MRKILTLCLMLFGGYLSAVEIVDGRGIRHNFSTPPKTASLAPVVTDLIFLLEAEDNLVAISAFSDARGMKIEKVGSIFGADWERIVSIAPEVVIMPYTMDDGIAKRLSGIAVKCVSLHKESLSGIVDDIIMLGDIFSREEKASFFAEQFRRELNNPYQGDKVRCAFLFSSVAAGKGSFVSDALNLCGFENCADKTNSPWPILSREFILGENPQVLFLAASNEAIFNSELARLRADSAWRSTDAVKKGKVFFVPLEDIVLPSVRVLNAINLFKKVRKDFQ